MVCRFARGKWSLSLLTWLWRFSVVAMVPMLVSATSSWISVVVWPFCWMAPPDNHNTHPAGSKVIDIVQISMGNTGHFTSTCNTQDNHQMAANFPTMLWGPWSWGKNQPRTLPPGWFYNCMTTNHKRSSPSNIRTIETLHLRLLAVLAFLQSFGVASLLAVEHESQHHNDVSHSCSHWQTDGLDHLVWSLVPIFVQVMYWFLCWTQAAIMVNLNALKKYRMC